MPGYSTVPPIAPGPAHVEPPMAVPVPPSEAGEWPIRDRAEAEFDPDKEIPDRDEVGRSRMKRLPKGGGRG